jgi:hypothetical protein
MFFEFSDLSRDVKKIRKPSTIKGRTTAIVDSEATNATDLTTPTSAVQDANSVQEETIPESNDSKAQDVLETIIDLTGPDSSASLIQKNKEDEHLDASDDEDSSSPEDSESEYRSDGEPYGSGPVPNRDQSSALN